VVHAIAVQAFSTDAAAAVVPAALVLLPCFGIVAVGYAIGFLALVVVVAEPARLALAAFTTLYLPALLPLAKLVAFRVLLYALALLALETLIAIAAVAAVPFLRNAALHVEIVAKLLAVDLLLDTLMPLAIHERSAIPARAAAAVVPAFIYSTVYRVVA